MAEKKSISRNKLNLFLDLGMALFFVVIMEVGFTGIRVHELLGLALIVAFLTHIVLHWRWLVSITRTFFARLFHDSRFNYVLNTALFVDMVVVMVTGILISETLGLHLGLPAQHNSALQIVHIVASYLSLIIVGLHIGVHWKWIVAHAKKYLFTFRLFERQPQPAPASPTPRDLQTTQPERASWEV